MANKNIVAIIPARGGSKGVPRKNVMDFCGRPLIAWTISSALQSNSIQRVFVTTEDKEIANISRENGAEIINRPAELATDTATAESALLHAIEEIEKNEKIDLVVYPQTTSPIRYAYDISKAIKLFMSENADSLFSAAVLKDFCAWERADGKLNSLTFDYKNRGRRQERKHYYLENGSIYIFKPEVIKQNDNRFGGKISIYTMPFWQSYEIDELEDIDVCEYYMKKKILND